MALHASSSSSSTGSAGPNTSASATLVASSQNTSCSPSTQLQIKRSKQTPTHIRVSNFLPSDSSDDAEEEEEDDNAPNGLAPARNNASKRMVNDGYVDTNGNGNGNAVNEAAGSSASTPTKKRKANTNGQAIPLKRSEGDRIGNGSGNGGGAAARRKEAERLFEKRQDLPFYQGRKMILDEIMAHETTIILGETGCGKSTQLPQILRSHPIPTGHYSSTASHANSGPSIAITQPRRLPAIALANRVAAESGSLLGGEVGYSVRFEEMVSRQTKVRFMTEGVLMRELANADSSTSSSSARATEWSTNGEGKEEEDDLTTTSTPPTAIEAGTPTETHQGLNLLLKYDIIIIDEAHERTLNTDFLCGALKKVQRIRKELAGRETKGKGREITTTSASASGEDQIPLGQVPVKELKIVIMSATLDPSKFQKFFDTGRDALLVKGRMYQVLTRHIASPVEDFIEAAARQVVGIHCTPGKENDGDILVFMPGSDEIENCVELLKRVSKQLPQGQNHLEVLPLYSALPPTAQAKIFAPPTPKSRRVIVATNIAETSLTIPGVSFVVDTGYKKEKEYIYRASGAIEQLKKKGISKAAAWQRTGRAGRERAGQCFRLFTKEAFDAMPEYDAPEIQRCNLSSAVLQLIAMGQNPFEFEYIDDPGRDAIAAAFQTLAGLSALTSPTSITPLGQEMLRFPLDPPHARILIASFELGCPNEIVDILSLINAGGHVFIDKPNDREEAGKQRAKFVSRDGDHATGLNVFRAYLAIKEARAGGEGGNMTNGKGEQHEGAILVNGSSTSGRMHKEGQTVLGWCKDNHVNGKTLAQALKVRNQLRELCERHGKDWRTSCGSELGIAMRAMLQGLFMNTAVIQADGSYRQTAGSLTVKIHPSSVLMSKKVPAIMYDELTITTAFYARNVSSFEQHWLMDIPWFANAESGVAKSVSRATV